MIGAIASAAMKDIIAFMLVMFCFSLQHARAQNERPLMTISYSDFEKLSDAFKTIYVAGIIDGESFLMFSNDDPRRVEWQNCVRAKPLGNLVAELISYVKEHPEEMKHPVAWPLSKVIGARRPCPPPKP